MKNHTYQTGRLIQTNKKFSALKQKQKEWITNELRERYIKMMKYQNIKLSLLFVVIENSLRNKKNKKLV
ncbi:hypothetical protein [Priestia megaterium]|jgi:hypothetical protein|uniref:hypothetical protein n=1 Tax=Priestia TaxID=2800373 RepID=UPI002E1BFB61|nr:hypothetical protein [Priestia megaterium]MED4278681.1 hypothetical protein [Priestia megaterium]MED4292662.1 hypothetical protein [Priestia megaterium]MED4298723.1 hypothetical protein [Priestia megaterium]MED4319540.1 hypothetical protein [Priestia megaterium]